MKYLNIALILLALTVSSAQAVQYDTLEIFPKNVGVFTVDGEQQFVAFVSASNDSSVLVTNVTTQVNWISSDPSKVTIDENGLAKVVEGVTMGNVTISCTYPKITNNMIPQYLLLILKAEVK